MPADSRDKFTAAEGFRIHSLQLVETTNTCLFLQFLLTEIKKGAIMKFSVRHFALVAALLSSAALNAQELRYVQVRTTNGVLEGVVSPDGKVRTFKGIPYAAPPLDSLRWRAPQPSAPWSGVRKAVDYPRRAMQGRIYDDMIFHDDGPSEDCLYLNIWMPENYPATKLPVMVWIHGGGFVAGSSSEPRQDAGNLCKRGVLVVSLNYRLGIFGFFSLPGLTQESGHNASGNYGLLDQVAALQWVKNNIAAFGGDPDNVTIFGESAGSSSVSGLIASPLAKGLFNRAIGESGAFFRTTPMRSRVQAEKECSAFADSALGTTSPWDLRKMPADKILDAALKVSREIFSPCVDGYFLSEDCPLVYAAGVQSHIPLLAGWNMDEGNAETLLASDAPTVRNFKARAQKKYGPNTEEFLKLYPAGSDGEAKRSAQDFGGDKSTAFAMWKWLEAHRTTGGSTVYRYEFDKVLPLAADAKPGTEPKAAHACEIEYVFRVLSSRDLPWTKDDYEVSELISSYWTNFAKTGDPNGEGLPRWPAYTNDGNQVMHLNSVSGSAPDAHRGRYEFLEKFGFGNQ